MVAFQPISLLVCVCLLASVSGEVPGDGDHGDGELGHGQKSCVCTRNEYFIHTSFNRTCKQDLLLEVRDAVRYLYKDVKHLANTSYWIHQGVYDLKMARERSTSELKYEIQHGFEEVNKKIDETQHLIRSESEKVITAQQTAVYKLAQKMLEVSQRNLANVTAQIADVKYACHEQKDKKRQLVWALREHCVPLLVQQNLDGTDFFNRSWADFRVGFSDKKGNYWLGNDLLSEVSQTGQYKLRFDMRKRENGRWCYAEYSTFVVQGEVFNYKLHVAGYTGNTGYDAFGTHDGMLFTTYDRDNDPWTNSRYHDNCAVYNGGGFWWASSQGYCGSCDVNAVRDVGEDFSWDLPRGQLKLQTSRMWLQCKHPYPSHVGH